MCALKAGFSGYESKRCWKADKVVTVGRCLGMPSLEDIEGALAGFGSFHRTNVEVKDARLSCDCFWLLVLA